MILDRMSEHFKGGHSDHAQAPREAERIGEGHTRARHAKSAWPDVGGNAGERVERTVAGREARLQHRAIVAGAVKFRVGRAIK